MQIIVQQQQGAGEHVHGIFTSEHLRIALIVARAEQAHESLALLRLAHQWHTAQELAQRRVKSQTGEVVQ